MREYRDPANKTHVKIIDGRWRNHSGWIKGSYQDFVIRCERRGDTKSIVFINVYNSKFDEWYEVKEIIEHKCLKMAQMELPYENFDLLERNKNKPVVFKNGYKPPRKQRYKSLKYDDDGKVSF
jgi:hypothetical protein